MEKTDGGKMSGVKEECGVFGIYDLDGGNIAPSIYYGLTSLQHRGQESCGMAVSRTDGERGNVQFHKDLGLVSEVLRKDVVHNMNGDIGIGHVRYSTTENPLQRMHSRWYYLI